MRLINAVTLELEDYTMSNPPQYAILSHTWEECELTYQEMLAPTSRTFTKKGYIKITKACEQARKDQLGWIWADTCCIDKTSSAELTEAINSMYEWYSLASRCYVYLSDLEPSQSASENMGRCRWFTRGWTLQELLAPTVVDFFDMTWRKRGEKTRYIRVLSKYTGISSRVLKGKTPVRDCSIAERMSWVSKRKTTREEDMAYCLLGIFDVNMPMVYGERRKAFRRLQEEIIKRNSDLTILAWDRMETGSKSSLPQAMNLLASSPAGFTGKADLAPFSDDLIGFQMTNKGLFISGEFTLRVVEATSYYESDPIVMYQLYLGASGDKAGDTGGICLRKIGPDLFYRSSAFPLLGFGTNKSRTIKSLQARDCHIVTDPTNVLEDMVLEFRRNAILVQGNSSWCVRRALPESLWDASDCIFLRPTLYPWMKCEMVMAVEISYFVGYSSFRLVVLCDYRSAPRVRLFNPDHHPLEAALVFNSKYRDKGCTWADLEMKSSDVSCLTNFTQVTIGEKRFEISASLDLTAFKIGPNEIELISLNIRTDDVNSQEARMMMSDQAAND